MHRERLTIIAEWLEAGAPHRDTIDSFDMSQGIAVDSSCQTACCIAGAATQFFGGRDGEFLHKFAMEDRTRFGGVGHAPFSSIDAFIGPSVGDLAKGLLGLDDATAHELFLPSQIDESDWGYIKPADAAVTIRNLLATGVVDWSHVYVPFKDGDE